MVEHPSSEIRDDPRCVLDERIPHDAYRPTFVKSLVMTPIGRDEPIGAIGCYWSVRYWATPEEMMTLEELANATAIVLNRLLAPDAFTEQVRLRQVRPAESSRPS